MFIGGYLVSSKWRECACAKWVTHSELNKRISIDVWHYETNIFSVDNSRLNLKFGFWNVIFGIYVTLPSICWFKKARGIIYCKSSFCDSLFVFNRNMFVWISNVILLVRCLCSIEVWSLRSENVIDYKVKRMLSKIVGAVSTNEHGRSYLCLDSMKRIHQN